MRRMIVHEWMTLDGVVQAPGTADEDTTGGFEHGGWHLPYFDDISREWVVDNLSGAGGFVFGRRTYENLGAYWPNAPEAEQALARPLNTLPKVRGLDDAQRTAGLAQLEAAWRRRRWGCGRAEAGGGR